MPRFDTSFNFVASAPKPKSAKKLKARKGGKKKPAGGGAYGS